MGKFRFFILGSLLILASNGIYAANPILKNIGMSDPHVRVFNDTVYLFTGHDQTPQDKVWNMRYWQVFSSTNLVDWNAETTISPKDNYMSDNSKDCWAGDAAMRNGKYYFYFSARNHSVGVMEAKRPDGAYKDALGHALMKPGHDPTIFVDDDADQTPYLVYGSNEIGGFHIAKLNDDLVSLAEKPKNIVINGEAWGNAPKWQDKNYIFKYKNTFYLSWGRDYAISKNIYGPYESVGAVGDGYKLSEFAHGSFFWWKGQFYHIWCYYIVDGLKYRESIITYCHFGEDEKIVTDTRFLDKHFENGVGQYHAGWDKIEAEWYYEVSKGIEKVEVDKANFALANVGDNSWVRFSKVRFDVAPKGIYASIKSSAKGVIEIRKGNIKGLLLGTIKYQNTDNQFITYTSNLTKLPGVEDLYLVWNTKGGGTCEFDWLSFSK